MPPRAGQAGAVFRAEKATQAGWTALGESAESYTREGAVLRRVEPLGPPLPVRPPGGGSWLPGALDWYEAFRVSPQSELIGSDIEWVSVQQAAGLYNSYLGTGNVKFWAAFAKLAGALAVTPLDMRRVRARIAEEQKAESAEEREAAEEQAEYDAEFERLTGLAS